MNGGASGQHWLCGFEKATPPEGNLAEPLHFFCRIGKPAEAIAAVVDRHQIDLIVMGSTGIGTLARLFLGSVAMVVARESKVPVTLVK